MNVTINFDYVTSEWRVTYIETDKTCISATGKTLKEALEGLKSDQLMWQIIIWFGIHPLFMMEHKK
jgi:hypothetical protein